MKLIDSTLTDLQLALDVRLRRHEVLSANIANADTPGYEAKDLDFEAAMARAQLVPPARPAASQPGAPQGGRVRGEGRTWIEILPPPTAAVGGPLPTPAGGSAAGPDAVVPLAGSSPGLDGNTVDLDRTMVAMSENALLYGAATKAVSKKLAILRYVASDGVG